MSQTLRHSTFRKGLEKDVMAHPVMTHPFWKRFQKGDLDIAQLRVFALKYYCHVKRTRLYAAAALSRTPFEDVQAAIASILWDEYGNGDSNQTHPEQFRRLLLALDLTESQWDGVREIPELATYVDTHYRLCTKSPFWVGLGVVGVAMELPIPTLYDYLVEGFLKSGVKEESLEFFVRHGPMDVHHADLILSAMLPRLQKESDRKAFQLGVTRSLDARSILMDGLTRITWAVHS